MASTIATAAAAAAVAMPSTDDAWKVAQKVRIAIEKELELIQKGGPGTKEIARFEKVDRLMENYRLACIETIWPDIRAALKKGAEETLWQTHALVTQTYRKVISRVQGADYIVLRRKLEKVYATYLKTAQYFYKGYLQRVCARYNLDDLRRIARRADLEEMPVPDKDKVDAAAAQLEDVVRESCHKTLIYLGDLARYRTLLRTRDRKWEGALAYYFLANELIPESGYGHHQCAVIYGAMDDDLQVVYHLYRALACARPHPNASRNLEHEFRELQKRRNNIAKHALLTWFVKLHAFYSQGKEFTERKELESEVDHRLALAMKTGTGYDSDMDLVKIALINITAYVAARDKISTKWTDEGSRSCQFILLLNVRTINAIANLLGSEISDLIERRSAETFSGTTGPSSEAETETKFTATFNRVLPLLRVYMAWLCSYGAQLVDFQAHLEPQFGAMSMTLSKTLTSLFELLGPEAQLRNPVPWRFPEDEITLGIECLNGPGLHDGCQLSYDAVTRKPKLRREDAPGTNYTEDDVTFTRALDILLCALDLSAPESKFPFITSTVSEGSQELTKFVFLEGGRPEPTPSQPALHHPTPKAAHAAIGQTPQPPVVTPSPCESNALTENQEFYGPALRNGTEHDHRSISRNGHASATVVPAQAAPASEFPIDKQLFNILNDFINPPEPDPFGKPQTPSRPPARTSPYGMDSAGVAEAFGAGASGSPALGSASAKAFPNLPWNYFYTPEPVGPAPRNQTTNGAGTGWGANGAGFSRPTSSGGATRRGAANTVPSPLAHQAHRRYDSFGRAGLVENQAEALQSLDLGSNGARQAQQGNGARGAWPNTAAEGSTSAAGVTSHLAQQNIWAPPASPWQTTTTHGQSTAAPATAGGIPASPFSTLNFSANTSSLPQVNSPWGLSTTAQRLSATQSPSSPNPIGTTYAGAPAPSPSATWAFRDYTAALAEHQTSPGFAGAWAGARQPRTGSGQPQQQQRQALDIWGNPVLQQPAANGNGRAVMGMPKR